MRGREKWIAATEEMWRPLRVADEEGRIFRMSVCTKNADLVVKTFFEDSDCHGDICRIHGNPAVVVGIDIREWTRRNFAVQSFMTANLNKNLKKVLEQLHRGGLIDFCDPINIAYTGDGATIIFGGPWAENPSLEQIDCTQQPMYKCLDEKGGDRCIQNAESLHCDESTIFAALSFVFSLNALTQQDNFGKRFNHTSGATREHDYAPLHLRYAISFGQIIPIIDAFDNLQFVGPPLVTCSRILSTDHGNHFLIDARLLHEMNKFGGISSIGKSKRSTNWDQELLVSELPDRQVKSGFFRYADVVGHHGDGPLLLALGKSTVNPVRYQIGSHDVRAFD